MKTAKLFLFPLRRAKSRRDDTLLTVCDSLRTFSLRTFSLRALLLPTLLFFSCASLYAQVTIGGLTEPEKGALLDLNSTSKGGLLFSNVNITDLDLIPADANTFMGIVPGTEKADHNPALAGMVVYNTNPATGVGLHIWDGEEWVKAGTSGSLSISGEASNSDPFPTGGNKTNRYTLNDPSCREAGFFSFTWIVGESYISQLNVLDAAAGSFTVTFHPNDRASSRQAILLVTGPCGNSNSFVFTQEANMALCNTSVTVPAIAIAGNSPQLCDGGSLFLYLDATISPADASSYIWTQGGIETGRGDSYTASGIGHYTVYYRAIGCPHSSQVNIVLSGSSTPSEKIDILVEGNNGIVCDPAGTVPLTTISTVGDPGKISWFKNGRETGQTGATINAGIGSWMAVIKEGACYTLPSRTVVVREDPSGSNTLAPPEITLVNASICKGSSLSVKVNSPEADVTYTWYTNNTQVGSGTELTFPLPDEVNSLSVGEAVVIRCRATRENYCPQEVQLVRTLSGASNIPRANILATNNGELCGGGTTFSVDNAGSNTIQWFDSPTSISPVQTGGSYIVTTPNALFYAELWNGGCAGERSSFASGGMSTSPILQWKTVPAGDHMDRTVAFYFEVQGDYVDPESVYTWSVKDLALNSPDAFATVGNQGSRITPITFNSSTPNGHEAVISVYASNSCGSGAPISTGTIIVGTACEEVTTPVLVTASQLSAEHIGVNFTMQVNIPSGGNNSCTLRWYRKDATNPAAAIESSNTTSITRSESAAGTYQYYCRIWPSCDTEGGAKTRTSPTIVVNVKTDPGLLTPGAGILTGPVCFDIAYSNSGGNCGAVIAPRTTRKRTFTSAPTQVYTFTLSGYTGLSFDYKNLNSTQPVIKSLLQNGTAVTVTFYSELDTWARGHTRANALKAELYAVYNGSLTTKLTLSVSDCQCCPGMFIPDGEYNDIAMTPTLPGGSTATNSTGSAADALLTAPSGGFKSKTGYGLCYYYRDANVSGASSATPTTYTWHNASGSSSAVSPFNNGKGVCQTTQGIDAGDAHTEWRLPNLGELAQIGQLVSSNANGGIETGIGSQAEINKAISKASPYNQFGSLPAGTITTTTGTYNMLQQYYWSSTQATSANAWRWDYISGSRRAYSYIKTATYYVRCVRRF